MMSGVGRSLTSPEAIEVGERQAKALNLRKAGVTFEAIAGELGYASASGAYEAVKSALAKTLREPAEEIRSLELARLDGMLAAISALVMAGDLDAIATALRISERRARLLGLDMRERMLSVKLPKLEKAQDALTIIADMLTKSATGELLPEEATKLSGLVQTFMKITETVDLSARIEALENIAKEMETMK